MLALTLNLTPTFCSDFLILTLYLMTKQGSGGAGIVSKEGLLAKVVRLTEGYSGILDPFFSFVNAFFFKLTRKP
jgi:hypothetical protein